MVVWDTLMYDDKDLQETVLRTAGNYLSTKQFYKYNTSTTKYLLVNPKK